jgi:hypothetical protein
LSHIGRNYWSALVLAGTAVVLVIVAAPAKAALAGAGFALAGSALTRAVDIAWQRRAEAVQAVANRRRDLDETRRLAYAVLHARRSRDGVIIATLVNALTHHGLAADPNAAAEHVAAVLNAPGLAPESEQWLRQQIDRITAALESLGRTWRCMRIDLSDHNPPAMRPQRRPSLVAPGPITRRHQTARCRRHGGAHTSRSSARRRDGRGGSLSFGYGGVEPDEPRRVCLVEFGDSCP